MAKQITFSNPITGANLQLCVYDETSKDAPPLLHFYISNPNNKTNEFFVLDYNEYEEFKEFLNQIEGGVQ